MGKLKYRIVLTVPPMFSYLTTVKFKLSSIFRLSTPTSNLKACKLHFVVINDINWKDTRKVF